MTENSRLLTTICETPKEPIGDHIDIQDFSQLSAWGRAMRVGLDVVREAIKAGGASARHLGKLSPHTETSAATGLEIL